MRICEVCGAEFEPKQKRSKYCSRECQVRAYSLSRPKTNGAVKTCLRCGKEFYTKYKQAKYCSDKCRISANEDSQRRYAEKIKAEKPVKIPKPKIEKPIITEGLKSKTCKVCGTEFYAENGHTKYCSDECKKTAYKKQQKEYAGKRNAGERNVVKEPIICLHCGKEFIPRSGNQIFCARECSTLYHRRLNNPPKERTCARCGKVFTVTKSNQQYCSDECRKKKEYRYSKKIVNDDKTNPKKKISPASKRWAKMSWERLTEELLYYGIKYRDAQVMAENNTLPKDFGIKRKRCK